MNQSCLSLIEVNQLGTGKSQNNVVSFKIDYVSGFIEVPYYFTYLVCNDLNSLVL